jgi:hypothetical protein
MRLSFKDWLLVIIRNKSIETSQTPRRGTAMRLPHSAELQPQTQLIMKRLHLPAGLKNTVSHF